MLAAVTVETFSRLCVWCRKLMKKLSLKPPERTGALQALWEQRGPADLGPCGEWRPQDALGAGSASDAAAASLQVASPTSTGVCATSWLCRAGRRCSG